jgi:lysophospholipase L1-like esterase
MGNRCKIAFAIVHYFSIINSVQNIGEYSLMKKIIRISPILALLLVCSAAKAEWVGTWTASPQPLKNTITFTNQTVRQVLRVSAGGEAVRIKISNLFGTKPVHFNSIHIALHQSKTAFLVGTDHRLSFNGDYTPTLAAGEEVWSDPVALNVPDFSEVAVSMYFLNATIPYTFHSVASETTFISTPGNFAGSPAFLDNYSTTQSWYFVTDISVDSRASAIVTIGDSITDGVCSNVNTNTRWPDGLANRLVARSRSVTHTVLNQGIGYNRVLQDQPDLNQPSISALSRFRHDVLEKPGVHYVILLEGINDIGMASTDANPVQMATAIIQGHLQMINEAHARGLKMYGATLLPIGGSGMDTPAKRQMRDMVNAWIRTKAPYDAVIDFDAAMRDTVDPQRMIPAFDCGDHVHPNSAGYQAMANSLNLSLF